MRILVIGASGFIGRALIKELHQAEHQVIAVSRNKNNAETTLGRKTKIVEWDGYSRTGFARHLGGVDAVVNLAGDNIASGRWTKTKKKKIISSRVSTGRLIAEYISSSPDKPSVFIQGSAIGYYGSPVNEPADETGKPGKGFMPQLVQEWESSISSLEDIIPRVIFLRTGLVLGSDGGILQKMLLPFKFYFGSVIGPGKQFMSWIHIRDEVRAIRYLIENENCHGAYNLTAPHPVNMETFMKCTGTILKKPVWLKVPAIILKIVLGKMAEETILASQNIKPGRLTADGFKFEFEQLEPALNDLLKN